MQDRKEKNSYLITWWRSLIGFQSSPKTRTIALHSEWEVLQPVNSLATPMRSVRFPSLQGREAPMKPKLHFSVILCRTALSQELVSGPHLSVTVSRSQESILSISLYYWRPHPLQTSSSTSAEATNTHISRSLSLASLFLLYSPTLTRFWTWIIRKHDRLQVQVWLSYQAKLWSNSCHLKTTALSKYRSIQPI